MNKSNDSKYYAQQTQSVSPAASYNGKLKKSDSTKGKGLGVNNLTNSIGSSVKKRIPFLNTPSHNVSSKIETPSNKKAQSTSGSKVLSESSMMANSRKTTTTAQNKYKKIDKFIPGKENKAEKKTTTVMTAPVKNIKQKVIGSKKTHYVRSGQKQTLRKNVGRSITHYQINTDIPGRQQQQTEIDFGKLTPRKNIHNQQSQKCATQNTLSLDMFQVGKKLGKGRFGDVYMARQILTGFVLAIKVINKKELKESHMEKQLIQEIRIQTFASHPNVLRMYSFFADQSKIYLLLELATNGCLFRQIRTKVYFSEDQASLYFRQVASAIRYLHSHCVMHRDIKPENILNTFGVMKLCDFGWATYAPIYQRQTFCGTLDYVPPQIVVGEFYDEKVDVWCLGVLCYQLCTGKAPFESRTDENQTYDKILKVDVDFPIYLSPIVVDIISKILHREPNKRLTLEAVETHPWMRQYQNEPGRMISKQIWENWSKLTKS